MRSISLTAGGKVLASVMSPRTTSTPCSTSLSAFSIGSTNARMCSPRCCSSLIRCPPSKPVAPVISIFMNNPLDFVVGCWMVGSWRSQEPTIQHILFANDPWVASPSKEYWGEGRLVPAKLPSQIIQRVGDVALGTNGPEVLDWLCYQGETTVEALEKEAII